MNFATEKDENLLFLNTTDATKKCRDSLSNLSIKLHYNVVYRFPEDPLHKSPLKIAVDEVNNTDSFGDS